jgi:hypothetical protein
MHGPNKKKLDREVKIEEGWMLQKKSDLIWASWGLYRVCQVPRGCKSASCDAAIECMVPAKKNLANRSRWKKSRCCKKKNDLIWAHRSLYRVCQLPGGCKSASCDATTECIVPAK